MILFFFSSILLLVFHLSSLDFFQIVFFKKSLIDIWCSFYSGNSFYLKTSQHSFTIFFIRLNIPLLICYSVFTMSGCVLNVSSIIKRSSLVIWIPVIFKLFVGIEMCWGYILMSVICFDFEKYLALILIANDEMWYVLLARFYKI